MVVLLVIGVIAIVTVVIVLRYRNRRAEYSIKNTSKYSKCMALPLCECLRAKEISAFCPFSFSDSIKQYFKPTVCSGNQNADSVLHAVNAIWKITYCYPIRILYSFSSIPRSTELSEVARSGDLNIDVKEHLAYSLHRHHSRGSLPSPLIVVNPLLLYLLTGWSG